MRRASMCVKPVSSPVADPSRLDAPWSTGAPPAEPMSLSSNGVPAWVGRSGASRSAGAPPIRLLGPFRPASPICGYPQRPGRSIGAGRLVSKNPAVPATRRDGRGPPTSRYSGSYGGRGPQPRLRSQLQPGAGALSQGGGGWPPRTAGDARRLRLTSDASRERPLCTRVWRTA
jgi:hypothetical protein